jgi:hypothetical protein
MSGIEIAGIGLGILPILVQVIKSYKSVSSAVGHARACTKELRSFEVNFNVQQCRFLNECELILRYGTTLTRDMMENAEDASWGDVAFESKLRERLGKCYSFCEAVIGEVADAHQDLEYALRSFDIVRNNKVQVNI